VHNGAFEKESASAGPAISFARRLSFANASRFILNFIVGEHPLPHGFQEKPIGHVQAYNFGFDRDINLVLHLAWAIGAQGTTYGVPDVLKSVYGAHPLGVVFVRFRPFTGEER